jgi:hypothetical protein
MIFVAIFCQFLKIKIFNYSKPRKLQLFLLFGINSSYLFSPLFQYRCDAPPTSESVRKLMLIVVETLEHQCHRCPTQTGQTSEFGGQQSGAMGPIGPEKKETRSAMGSIGLLDAPTQGGGEDWTKYLWIILNIPEYTCNLFDYYWTNNNF